jgi:hypothetical protein
MEDACSWPEIYILNLHFDVAIYFGVRHQVIPNLVKYSDVDKLR